jgi:DNA-binding XRE family transcriptional regulator
LQSQESSIDSKYVINEPVSSYFFDLLPVRLHVVSHRLFRKVVKTRIRAARERVGLTLEQAAEQLNVSLRYYQRLESASEKIVFNPSLETLLILSEFLHITLEDLLRTPTPQELEIVSTGVVGRGRPRKKVQNG